MRASEIIRSFDWIALGAAALLIALGLVMLASATYTEGVFSSVFIRQATAAGIGLLLLVLLTFVHHRTIVRYTWLAYLLGVLGLVGVAVFGTLVRGTVSRLEFFGVQIQPSEFVKVGFLLTLAWLGSRLPRPNLKMVVVTGFALALPVAFILLEPDLGMAALLVATWFGLLVFRGLPGKWVIVLLLAGAVIGVGSWQWFLADYQKERLQTFLDPSRDPLGGGYNITQSVIALGSGQFLGRGLGHGPQSQLKFLPERHTDFILASIGEELGFLGIGLVIVLYAILLWRIFLVTRTTRDPFVQIYSAGVFLLFLASFIVSAGMNMGVLPVTGIPLPLVSFGGSNLVSTCILLGILHSMRVQGKWTDAPPAELSHF